MSSVLLKTQLQTMSLADCKATFNAINNSALKSVAMGHYCAYDPNSRNDSCQGDSGGPLQYFKQPNNRIASIVGIVSFGISCGTRMPGIYTRVAYYLNWIESHVWPNEK